MNTTNTQKIEAAEMLLKDTQVILAALKAETEPKREPKAGDVFESSVGFNFIYSGVAHDQCTGLYTDGVPSSLSESTVSKLTRLGTFNEVYMLRSEGISKKELRDYIGAIYTRGEGCTGYDLKTAIIGKFNLNGK